MHRLISDIQSDLAQRFGVNVATSADGVTREPGAYLILLNTAHTITLPITTLAATEIPKGHYIYAGSARGPGGLRARIARHLRRGKRRHWHIDHLTENADTLAAFPIPGSNECALVQTLVMCPQYHHPLPGFGSSDCPRCVSHLLQVGTAP